jgi:hypothetical protein
MRDARNTSGLRDAADSLAKQEKQYEVLARQSVTRISKTELPRIKNTNKKWVYYWPILNRNTKTKTKNTKNIKAVVYTNYGAKKANLSTPEIQVGNSKQEFKNIS